jgi:outer membrane lipoprotein-sorting protein
VTSIGSGAFSYCSSLTSATIVDNVTSIDDHRVTKIGSYAFADCRKLSSISIGNRVTWIGEGAFDGYNGLRDVTVGWNAPLSIEAETFSTPWLSTLHVPAGTLERYKEADVWKDFGNFVEQSGTTGLSVSPAAVIFASNGGTQHLSVTADAGWTAVSSASWLSVSPAASSISGTLVVTAEAHSGGSARTAAVIVTDGSITQTVTVTQVGTSSSGTALMAVPAALDFDASGGTLNVVVTSNTNWTAVSSATWLTLTPASGTGDGLATVTAAANTGEARTATVTVAGGDISVTVTVTQAPATASAFILTVAPVTLDFNAAGGTLNIAVASNTNWTAVGSATWLTFSPASGANDGTVGVTAAANTGAARTGTVIVMGGGLMRTVNITQAAVAQPGGATLTVAPAALEYEADGGALNIAVMSNTNWTAVSSATWLTLSPASGANDGTVSATATANTGAVRTATVTVAGGGILQTVAVTQTANQQIVVNPLPPGSGTGINVALNLPVNEPFTVQFVLSLPTGFQLDMTATALAPGLSGDYELTILPSGTDSWLFVIRPAVSTHAAGETSYQDLLHIDYTVAGSVAAGDYEVKFSNVDLTLDDGTTVHQDEISVSVTFDGTTGIESIGASQVWFNSGILHVNTPAAERVDVYSLSGLRLHSTRKAEGEARFDLNDLPRGVLIVRGSSGWTRKIVK